MTRFTFLPPGVFPSPLTVAPLHPSLLRSGPEAQGPRTASRGAQNAPRPRHSHWARGLARGFRHWAKSTLLAITSSLYRVCSLCSPSFSGQSRPGLAVSRERAWASSHYRQHTARPLWYQNQELKKIETSKTKNHEHKQNFSKFEHFYGSNWIQKTWRRYEGWRAMLSLLAGPVFLDHVRYHLADHDDGGVGISGYQRRHDGRVSHSQSRDSVHSESGG